MPRPQFQLLPSSLPLDIQQEMPTVLQMPGTRTQGPLKHDFVLKELARQVSRRLHHTSLRAIFGTFAMGAREWVKAQSPRKVLEEVTPLLDTAVWGGRGAQEPGLCGKWATHSQRYGGQVPAPERRPGSGASQRGQPPASQEPPEGGGPAHCMGLKGQSLPSQDPQPAPPGPIPRAESAPSPSRSTKAPV